MQIKGMDVSHHQGSIDWTKVKADGVQFVFIKATQGLGYKYVDYFRNHAPKALGNGIHTGAYHYGYFSTVPEAIAQAKYFISVVKDFKLDYPLVLDLEENKQNVSKKQLTDVAIAFLEYVENAGYFAMLYTGKSFLDSSLDASRLKPYALWIARYGASLGMNADIWQYSSSGHVNGISGTVDMNWSYRDFAAEIESKQKEDDNRMKGVVKVDVHTVVRKGPNAAYGIVSTVEKGQAYKCYGKQGDWYNVGGGWLHKDYVTYKGV